jgi:hypothetical protein
MNKKLLILVLSLFLAGCDLENQGVLTNNQIPASVFDFMDEKNILEDEYVIAYYDFTIFLDNSESAILTNKNAIYYKNGRVSKIPLRDIESVDHESTTLEFIIYVTPTYGPIMTIPIASLNRGSLFLDLLTKEVEKNRYKVFE